MLYTGGSTQRLGRVDEGNTVTDYDEEEVARSMSVGSAAAYVEWGKTKINVIDAPGFNMFVHEAELAMPAVEAAAIVVDGVAGVEVMTERVWQYTDDFALPRIIVASRMDRDRADATRTLDSLTTAFGRLVIPVQLPIGSEKSLRGMVDLVRLRAYTYELGGNGKGKEGDIPADMAEAAKEGHEKIVELIAEGNDALMEEFFDKGTIADEHLLPGLREAIRDRRIFPVLYASGLGNLGADRVLDFVAEFLPASSERAPVTAASRASNGEPAT